MDWFLKVGGINQHSQNAYIERFNKTKRYSAVFPEDLVGTILKNFTNENDIIYDPFMGTGTTAVVSARMNRTWLGSEINEEYCKTTAKRVATEKAQLKIGLMDY